MNKNAFSIAELIVSISIIIILSSIWFISYTSYIWNARDTQRKSDISLISSALKREKQQRWYYPNTWNGFNIVYQSSNILAIQWKLNSNVSLSTLEKLPLDPKIDIPYIYSITKNAQEFEVALTLENSWIPMSILSWDYKSVSVSILPTIILAKDENAWSNIEIASWVGNWSTNRNAFVLNEQTENLPYTFKSPYTPQVWSGSIDTLVSQQKAKNLYWQNSSFRNCIEIQEAWKLLSTWTTLEYQTLNENWILINTNCP
jgi:type II secretory pathway pseudopilin PulG